MCLLFFGSFCSAEGLCLLRTVNVSGRVNCLITRLISVWPSLIWALMGLCCLGFVWTCVCVCLWCTVRASFSCLIVAGKRTCITRVSVPNWLSAYINFSVSIGYWIMFVHFSDFLQWTFAVIKHSLIFFKYYLIMLLNAIFSTSQNEYQFFMHLCCVTDNKKITFKI